VGGVDINVLPKAGIGKTAQLLAYGAGLAAWQTDWSWFDQSSTFTDALAPMYLDQVEQIISAGLVEDYVTLDERGTSPKGRIDFGLVARTGIPLPAEYSYDEFTADTPLNRLLLRAVHEVIDLPGIVSETKANARKLLAEFTQASYESHPTGFDGGYLESRTSHYRTAALLATLLINRLGLEPTPGTRFARGLLFDMNRVFEAFIISVARRASPAGMDFDIQGNLRPIHLDGAKMLRLHPDFSLWDGGGCRLVGDAKYKVIDARNPARRSDLYQALAYATAAKCKSALLVYVGEEPHDVVRIAGTEILVTTMPIDLSIPIPEIERQLGAVLADASAARPAVA
jgi:5-methylcytosine-specific restriction enzyme subunit McrC